MKIYVVHGFGYDPQESSIETYAIVFKSREDAEKKLEMIIEEQSMFAKSESYYGVEVVETIRKRNGKISHYKIEMIYDIRKSEHKVENPGSDDPRSQSLFDPLKFSCLTP